MFVSAPEDFYTGGSLEDEDRPDEPYVPMTLDLPTYVLKQVSAELCPEERPIAAYILSHLDEDGFLTTTPLEIARYYHKLPSQITPIIERLKHCDPIGVCSA